MADEYSLTWKRSISSSDKAEVSARLKDRAIHLVLEIEMALLGLCNLKSTYCGDFNAQVKLQVLIEKIASQILIFKDILELPRTHALSRNHIPPSREILILSID